MCYSVKATKVDTDDERNRYQEFLQFTCVLENLPLKDLLVECCQCASKVSDFLNPDRRKTRQLSSFKQKMTYLGIYRTDWGIPCWVRVGTCWKGYLHKGF